MADGSGSAAFMNLSDSAHDGAMMEIDGFTSNTIYTVTVEESIETKQWVLPSNTPSGSADQVIGVQPPVGGTNYFPVENTVLTENGSSTVQQDDLCQDDMFSFDELSAVDGQAEPQVVETTVGTADVVTSVSGHGYESYLSSGEIDGTRCVPGERSEMGLNETDEQDVSLNIISGSVDWAGQQTNGHLVDKGKEEDLEGTVTLNRSSVDIDTNACPGEGLIGTSTFEGHTHENLQFEADVKTDIHLAKESVEINDDQQTSEVREKAHTSTENHVQIEPLTVDANQLKEAPEEVNVSIGNISQHEVVNYHTDQLTSEPPPVVVTSTEEFVRSSVATDVLNDKNKQLKHSNTDSSEYCREYLPKELECQSDLKQSQMTSLNEQMSLSDEKHLEPSAMKAEENTQLEQAEIVAKNDEQEAQLTQEIEMPLVKEEEVLNNEQSEKISNAMQTALRNDQQAKSQDVNQIPTSDKIEPQERQVCMFDSSAETNEPSANVTQKEDIVSADANPPHEEEQSKNEQQIGSAVENMSKIPTNEPSANVTQKEDIVSADANPPHEEEQSKNEQQIGSAVENMSKIPTQTPIFQGTIESHVEHIEDRDDEQRQLELLKGRKVAKRFGKRKYMGEVIGYDPASKWFKVLYEDGDEEELEKHEVDAILILHGEEASVSRKRQLSPTNMDHEESNRSEKKSRKVDRDGAPGRQRKTKILKDETPGSHRLSNTKKQKSNAAKSGGKGKSPKTNVRKGQKGTGKSTSTKKSIGKKRTAKKSESSQIKEQQKSHVKEKLLRNEGKQDSAEQHVDEVTRKLKYGSSKKKTPTKAKRKANEIPKKGKEAEMPEVLMTTKPEVDAPGRKRKALSGLESGSSTVSHKRTKRAKVVNDLESPLEKRTQLTMISKDTPELPSQAEEDKPQSAVPTGKKGGRGTDLVGRKVKKDFGRKLYGGVVVGYKMFYKVKYEDGDSEDLTWKELESILLPEEDHVVQDKSNEQHQGTKHSSAKSKGKKKT